MGLQSDTVDTYRVRSVNSIAASEWSNEATAATPLTAPLAPTNLKATVISAGRVDLTWHVIVTNETAVAVWRKTGSGAFQRVAALPPGSTSYSDTSVTTGSTYTYQVRTVNDYLAMEQRCHGHHALRRPEVVCVRRW